MPTGALAEAMAEVLRREGSASLRVHGRSMWPWVLPGTDVRLVRVDPDELSPGDLVLYRRGDGLVLHRAIRRAPGAWLVRADGGGSDLEEVSDERILARSRDMILGSARLPSLPRRVEVLVGSALVVSAPLLTRGLRKLARARGVLRTAWTESDGSV